MRPYLARAGVVVVPLRMGGGTRIKILEALAMGKPIVSTTIGAENLGGRAEQHFLLADTPSAFAEKTALLLKNPTTGRGLGQAARKFVETRYSWKTCASKLEETWRKACASK
jgi:glycosyltransferase involved in cell wall biosynthesis